MTDASQSADLAGAAAAHGFELRREVELANLRSVARELVHRATGAKVLHVFNDDTENLFSITFPTPPPDDTGVPHILEHSVLDGSKKFPVRRPFFEMIKMSMATFINAMTAPDRTMYPVASNVRRDLFNLAEVYFDAVFHPRLSRHTFMQEAHHLAFESKGDTSSALTVNGIVYNEMKGAFSNAEALVGRRSFNGLFPDTPYGLESGGDPERIPDLTWEELCRFHSTLYHPSNAHFFLYGDIPTEQHLAFLGERLQGFESMDPVEPIPPQPRWTSPRAVDDSYPLGKDEDAKDKTYITLNWIAGDGTDTPETLAFSIIDLALLGNQAAPLRKAIVDSGLGRDLTHSGFHGGMRESVFTVGLRGSEPDRREAFEALVADTLAGIVRDGIPKRNLDAAFQQIAYRYREIRTLHPLHVMMRVLPLWTLRADPVEALRADELIAELRTRADADPGMFGRLIRERLIDNPHRLSVVVRPEPGLQAKKDAKFANAMAERKASLGEDELAFVAREAAELDAWQGAGNSPEALATLPQLTVADLPRKPKHIPTAVEKLDCGAELLRNDVFANGVNYLQIAVDLTGLPEELLPCLTLYADCVGKMGAAGEDYVRIAERKAAHTGGIGFGAGCGAHSAEASRTLFHGMFGMKALDEEIDGALDVFRDIVFSLDFDDDARLRDVTGQRMAELRSYLAGRGAMIAVYHAGRGLSPESRTNALIRGLPQFRMIEEITGNYDEHRERLARDLARIRDFMIGSMNGGGRVTASFTGSDDACRKVRDALPSWLADTASVDGQSPARVGSDGAPVVRRREGLAAPMDVAHCACVIPAPHHAHPDSPALAVGGRLLSLAYLLEEIRVKGGAYGAGGGHDAPQRRWSFSSYNDPSVKKTLDVFGRALDYVRGAEWSRLDVERAVIGTAKEAERPIRPDGATGIALARYLSGETPELREAHHAAVLAVGPEELKAALVRLLEEGMATPSVCVVSSRERLAKANEEMPDSPLVVEDILRG